MAAYCWKTHLQICVLLTDVLQEKDSNTEYCQVENSSHWIFFAKTSKLHSEIAAEISTY